MGARSLAAQGVSLSARKDANYGLGMAQSYYVASANACAEAAVHEDDIETDLCVVGGGGTGLSAALKAAEDGASVVLLEAGRVGWGASGRNGGQAIPGLRKGAAELIAMFGAARAKELFALSLEARALVLARIARHGIQCDLKTSGHLTLAAKPSHLDWMREECEVLARVMDYPHARVIGTEEALSLVDAPGFHGGLLLEEGGHVHPLNLTLGLAAAARGAGVRLFENSAALKIEQSTDSVLVRTEQGSVRAKHVVLACDALLGDLYPLLNARFLSVANYLVATQPLDAPEKLIANDLAVADSRFVVNYFRLSADGRLIFGGGEGYSAKEPGDIAGRTRKHMLKVFPQLADVRIDYAWGGLVSITMNRLPHVGREGNVWFAHGYSGEGVLMSILAGEVLAEAIGGNGARFELMGAMKPSKIPGGAALRMPAYVLGMLYYSLLDRL